MAIHTRSDVVIPEVISGEVVQNALFAETPLLRSPYVLDMSAQVNQLYTDGGDTVTFLTQEFGSGISSATSYVKDAVRTSKTGATGEVLKIDKYTEAVTDKQIPIEADILALEDCARQADVNGWIARVLGQAMSETIHRDLIIKANANGNTRTSQLAETTKTLTVDAILKGKIATFGEKAATLGPVGLFLHSKQFQDLASTSDYKTLASAANNALVAAEAANGAVSMIHGCLLYLSDSIPNTAGVALTGITRASAVATATTDVAHGLAIGDIASISGATQTEYNGDVVVASVPSATTFTYAVSGTPATPATGTLVLTPNYNGLFLAPNSLGLLVKDVRTFPEIRSAGTSVVQIDTLFRWVSTRFKRKPMPVGKLVTR